jgi:hypothetical protein
MADTDPGWEIELEKKNRKSLSHLGRLYGPHFGDATRH